MFARGLFRVWCVLAICWVALIAVLPEYAGDTFMPMALVPPTVILAIGAGLVWAGRGFRRA